MSDRLYLHGRVVASTPAEAEAVARQQAREVGYEAIEVKVWAALIQPWEGVIWWVYLAKVDLN